MIIRALLRVDLRGALFRTKKYIRRLSYENSLRVDCIFQSKEPAAYGSLTEEQFSEEIEKGMKDIKSGRVFSAYEGGAEIKL